MSHNILIVEDEAIEAMSFEQSLSSFGYEVVGIASTGEGALQKVADLRPDLVLMDIILKGEMDGIEAAAKIKENFDIPVIYLTAHPEESAVKRAKLTSPYGYLIKPVSKTDLYNSIELALYKHKMESKLKESENRYRSIVENVLDAYFRGDAQGRIIMASPSAARMYGFDSPQDMMGLKAVSLYKHPEDRQILLRELKKHGKVENMEGEGLRKDGSSFWTSINAQYVYDDQGRIQGTEAFVRDITETKKAEKELEKSKLYYRAIFEHTGTATVIIEEDSTISLANAEFEKLSGYSKKEIEGRKSWTEFVVEDDLEKMKKYHSIRRTDPSAAPTIYDFKFKDKKGRIKNIHLEVDMIPGTKKSVASLLNITELKKAEEMLQEREKFLSGTLNDMNTFVAILKTDGEIIFINNTPLKLIGKDLEDVKGMMFYDVDWWTFSKESIQNLKHDIGLCASGEIVKQEIQLQTHEGLIWIDFSMHPICDDKGEVINLVAEGRDITDRKMMEKSLADSEKYYRDLVDNAMVGVFRTNLKGEVLFANKAMAQMFQYDSITDLKKDNIGKLYKNPEDREKLLQKLKKEGNVTNYEVEAVGKHGKPIKTLASISLRGDVLSGMFMDITDYQNVLDGLKESEEKYRSVVENAAEGIILLDIKGKIIEVNDSVLKFSGFTREELIGLNFVKLLPRIKIDVKQVLSTFKDMLRGNQLKTHEWTMINNRGEQVTFIANYSPIKKNKKIIGFSIVLEDITERKKSERAILESEEKYRKLFEEAVDGIALADIHTGKLIDVNKSLAQLVGRERSELIGQHQSILHPKEDLKGKFTKTFNNHILNKEGQILEGQIITKTGDRRDVEIKASKIEFQGLEVLQGIFHDITQRKLAEKRLKLHHDRLNASLKLHKISDKSKKEILNYVLEACLKFVESKYAFIGLMNEDETVLNIHLWSKDVMKECTVSETPIHFPIKNAGMWGECVKQRRPVIVNDYEASKLPKKGYPSGHVHLKRFMAVPIFDGPKIVLVAAVANKEEEYNDDDLQAFNSLLNDMWKIIQRKNIEKNLIQSLREKENLLKEIHHRVKNNLQIISSLLDLQVAYVDEEESVNVLKESQNRVLSMAMIHEMLYQSEDLSHINFSDYIRNLVSNLFHSYNVKPSIQYVVNLEEIYLNIETSIPLGLIISELVSNSLKHAFPDSENGSISISIDTYGDEFELIVSDDGVGLPEEVDLQTTKSSLGLRLVNSLVNQIDGTIELDRSQGTRYTIKFRELKYKKRI